MIPLDLLGLAQIQALTDELGSLGPTDPIMLSEKKRACFLKHCLRPDATGALNWSWWWHDVSNVLRLDDGSVKLTVVAQDLYGTDQVAVLAKNPNSDGTMTLIERLDLALESLDRYRIAIRDGQTVGRMNRKFYRAASQTQVDTVVAYLRAGRIEKTAVVNALTTPLLGSVWNDDQRVFLSEGSGLTLTVDEQQTLPDSQSITLRAINLFKQEEAGRFEASWAQLERTLLSHAYTEIPAGSGNWIIKDRKYP